MADHLRTCAGRTSLGVAVALFGFAAGMMLLPSRVELPLGNPAAVPAWAVDSTPVRRPRMQPEYKAGGYTYRCSECHLNVASPAETYRQLTQHREINLQHGINTRCFNCHHRTNRDAFVDDYGNEIPWDKPQLLCAKCHGPVYRDWQHGAHGRTNGYWDVNRGAQTRIRCIECHDPHRPPFAPLKPAPPPDTLRMGPQSAEKSSEEHDPLKLGSRGTANPSAEANEAGDPAGSEKAADRGRFPPRNDRTGP